MMKRDDGTSGQDMRAVVARGFTWVEDVVYVGMRLLLAAAAVVLLGNAAIAFLHDLFHAEALAPRLSASSIAYCSC
jgi:hypothetical protein